MADPKNYHPHSRFSLHERANLYPFRDIIWGRTDGPFIDLKVDYPDPSNHYADGSAFLRTEDVVEMAHCLGMATREEVERYEKRIKDLEAQVAAIPLVVGSYKNELSGVTERFLADLATGSARFGPVALAPIQAAEDKHEVAGAEQPSLFDSVEGPDKGSDTNHSNSGRTRKSNAKPSHEPPVSKGTDDVPSPVSDSTESLSGFLGLG